VSDIDRGMAGENNRLLHELLGAVRGLNGDGGLIGRVSSIGEDVTTIRITIPTLMTKDDCVNTRGACELRRGGFRDRKWMRTKDAVLVAVAVAGMIGTFLGVGKALGWF